MVGLLHVHGERGAGSPPHLLLRLPSSSPASSTQNPSRRRRFPQIPVSSGSVLRRQLPARARLAFLYQSIGVSSPSRPRATAPLLLASLCLLHQRIRLLISSAAGCGSSLGRACRQAAVGRKGAGGDQGVWPLVVGGGDYKAIPRGHRLGGARDVQACVHHRRRRPWQPACSELLLYPDLDSECGGGGCLVCAGRADSPSDEVTTRMAAAEEMRQASVPAMVAEALVPSALCWIPTFAGRIIVAKKRFLSILSSFMVLLLIGGYTCIDQTDGAGMNLIDTPAARRCP